MGINWILRSQDDNSDSKIFIFFAWLQELHVTELHLYLLTSYVDKLWHENTVNIMAVSMQIL